MKNIIYKFSLFIFGIMMVTSCSDLNDIPIYDVQGGRAIAGFNSSVTNPTIIFNPAADTENVITIGVSTLSNQDRAVSLSVIAAETTLDPAFYEISTLNPVIRAGEYTTDITITTFGSSNIPPASAKIALRLNSVEGAEILASSRSKLLIGLKVQCPTVDIASLVGTYKILVDDFGTSVGDDTFEVVAGPGANQVTFVNPFDHPNPADGGEQSYKVTLDINPTSGAVTVARQSAWHYSNFAAAPAYGVGSVDGAGTALTCIGQIELSLTFRVAAGSFGTYKLVVKKQ